MKDILNLFWFLLKAYIFRIRNKKERDIVIERKSNKSKLTAMSYHMFITQFKGKFLNYLIEYHQNLFPKTFSRPEIDYYLLFCYKQGIRLNKEIEEALQSFFKSLSNDELTYEARHFPYTTSIEEFFIDSIIFGRNNHLTIYIPDVTMKKLSFSLDYDGDVIQTDKFGKVVCEAYW